MISLIRDLAASDPAWGLAFRRILDSNVSSEDLLKWVKAKEDAEKKG